MLRFTNTLLLILLAFLAVSGVWMLYGDWQPWIFDLHRWIGFSLVAILPWKGAIIYRSLRRGFDKTFDRSAVILASLALAGVLILVIVFGLLWMFRIGPFTVVYQTLLAWHWIVGLLLIPLFTFHLWRRWPAPRPSDVLSRRNFLKLAAFAGVGFAQESCPHI
jgi:cytochrome b561